MLRAYQYIFYKLYRWAENLGADRTPEYTAFVAVVLLTFIYLLSIIKIIDVVFNRELLSGWSKGMVFFIFFLLAVPQYLILVYDKKYQQIVAEFEGMSNSKKATGTTLVVMFILISISMVFIMAFF